jgi:hypothetical protein
MLGGVRWSLDLSCSTDSDASKQAVQIGLFACARSLPHGSLCRCTFNLECVAGSVHRGRNATHQFDVRWGWRDFFKLGPMSGGFDEAAWAAKRLPANGSIVLRLTVMDVGM